MCLFIECAQGYHNSSLSCPHPQRALSYLPFSPFLFLTPPSILSSQQFFPLLRSFQPSSVMHSLLFSLSFLSLLTLLPLFATPPFHSDHSPSFQHPSSLWISSCLLSLSSILSSLSFHSSIPPSAKAMDQGRDGLIAA